MTHGKKVHKKRRRFAKIFVADIRIVVTDPSQGENLIPEFKFLIWEIFQKPTSRSDYLQIGAGGSGKSELVRNINKILRSSIEGNPPVNNLMPWITSIDNEHKTEMGEE